ncbi:MAG: S8 family serine peptidase, partial [Planctomycetota bacterium]
CDLLDEGPRGASIAGEIELLGLPEALPEQQQESGEPAALPGLRPALVAAVGKRAASLQLPTGVAGQHWSFQVHWAEDTPRSRIYAALRVHPLRGTGAFGRLHGYRFSGDGADARRVRRDLLAAGADSVGLAPLARPALVPDDGFYAEWQWNLHMIGMEAAWEYSTGSPDVRVAVLDAGFDLDHRELRDRFVDGWDFVSDVDSADDGDGRDPVPSLPAFDDPSDSHATHVSGIIGAEANGALVVGMDHACRIMPLRVLGTAGGDPVDIWQALIYAADLQPADLQDLFWYDLLFPDGMDPDRPRPTKPADVINLSFAGSYSHRYGGLSITIYEDLLQAIKDQGIVLVAAAGNNGRLLEDGVERILPAASRAVITVASVGPELRIAGYSSGGLELDLLAPGGIIGPGTALDPNVPDSGGILSTVRNDGVSYRQGTSMAAPHVSGLASLMLAVDGSLTPDQIEQVLEETALDLGETGADVYAGAGMIRADRALERVAGAEPVDRLVALSDRLLIPWHSDEATVHVARTAVAPVQAAAMDWSVDYPVGPVDWVVAITAEERSDGLLAVHVRTDRGAMPPGLYGATLIGRMDGLPAIRVPLQLEVLEGLPPEQIGRIYVLVVRADDMAVVDGATLQPGERSFRINDLAPGRYHLLAGTDRDGDDIIDDDGEFFGFHPGMLGFGVIEIIARSDRPAVDLTLVRTDAFGG